MLTNKPLGDLLFPLYVSQLSLLTILLQLPRIPNRMRPAHIESSRLKAWPGFMISKEEFLAKVVAQSGIAHHQLIADDPRQKGNSKDEENYG